ncbi:MAG: glycosyltransferase, partial [Candidatus Sumerlaeaceae bacterium]|nr:glycosyltransferase [Candidatus Sumerlaeaceae bacterium]
PLIPAKYGPKKLAGKAVCKAALQKELGLDESADTPLIGVISRLDPQKGFDLIAEAMETLLSGNVQVALLGTVNPEYHALFEKVAAARPRQFSANLKFDNGLAHRIEAGCDMFLMPSRYEPCGLNQLYSLKYGTIPIVRSTGGLADSITDATPELIKTGDATGFAFADYTSAALLETVKRALAVYGKKTEWKKVMQNAMAKDFSWKSSAHEYVSLFESLVKS